VDWLPAAAQQGGPWAALFAVVLGVSFLYWRGVFVSSNQVDRLTKAYEATIAHLDKELVYWRAAAERKDVTIGTQADQIHQLMGYTALGTHALEEILKEARKREVGEARE
jgi:hypothetical protein